MVTPWAKRMEVEMEKKGWALEIWVVDWIVLGTGRMNGGQGVLDNKNDESRMTLRFLG